MVQGRDRSSLTHTFFNEYSVVTEPIVEKAIALQ